MKEMEWNGMENHINVSAKGELLARYRKHKSENANEHRLVDKRDLVLDVCTHEQVTILTGSKSFLPAYFWGPCGHTAIRFLAACYSRLA